jgi:hypothetical protein
MRNVSVEDIQRTISQLGEGDRRATEIEIAVRRFANDPLTVRRLVDWVPEAFGYVLLPHVADLVLPGTFTAKAKDGTWKEFAFDREPVFGLAVTLAADMYRDGPRTVFSAVAKRSTMVSAANQALSDGVKLSGVKFAGPAMAGIPAEFYDPKARPAATSFWKKLVG